MKHTGHRRHMTSITLAFCREAERTSEEGEDKAGALAAGLEAAIKMAYDLGVADMAPSRPSPGYIEQLESTLTRARKVMERALCEHERSVCGTDPVCSTHYPPEQRCWVCHMNLMIEEIDNL